MFERLKNMLSGAGADATTASRFDPGDYRLVAAALLIHAAGIDGDVNSRESERVHALVKQRFRLDDAAADELVAAATRAESAAIDLYHFTSRLNRTLDDNGRAKVIEMMWQVVFADGKVTEFEDNLVWRVADLLGISGEERIALRQRVGGPQ